MGLLDALNSDEGRLGLGLLMAAGPSMQPMGLGQRIAQGMGYATQQRDDDLRRQYLKQQMDSGLLSFEKNKRDHARDLEIDAAARSSIRSPEMANAMSMGPSMDGGAVAPVSPGFDPAAYAQKLYGIDPIKALQFEQSLVKDNTPISVAPGASLIDRKTLKPVFTAPKEMAPTELEKLIAARENYPPNHPIRAVFDNAIRKASTHTPGTTVNVSDGLGLKPKDRFEMEGKLSDDFAKATQLDRGVLNATSKISAAFTETGAMKDQAAIYSFAKMLDPEGAVREADYAAIAGTAGLIDRVRNYANKLLTGEQLSPNQRAEMVAVAKAFEGVANARIGPQRNRFSTQAQRYNLSPDAVLDPQKASTGWSITPVPGR